MLRERTPKLKLILTHEWGHKWTEFLGKYIDGVIQSILGVKPLIEAEDDTVIVEFRFGQNKAS